MSHDGEYRLTSKCDHPGVARIRPQARPTPGPDLVVQWTCPTCGIKGIHLFRYNDGDQREPGAWWANVGTRVAAAVGDPHPEPA